jgi:hypothetical protein
LMKLPIANQRQALVCDLRHRCGLRVKGFEMRDGNFQ